MGIFRRDLVRSRDKPKNSLPGENYGFFTGRSFAGKNVNERTSMQVAAVYACVRVLSEAVASLPLDIYRYSDGKGSERADRHPLHKLLRYEPNPEMTSFTFREVSMTHLLLWGNSYSQIIRNGKGEVLGLYPLMPDRMTVDRDPNTKRIIYKYRRGNDEAGKTSGTVVLKADDVLHIPGLGFDGLVGYSPIALAKQALGTSIAVDEFSSKFFANGASPAGVLEHPGTLKDPEKVRQAWNKVYGGSENANKVAVLEEGMKYTPISIAPNDAQFLETRKFNVEEIARIFRVPLHMIGDLDHATFSNIEHQDIEFVKHSLTPWLIRWEQAMHRRLFLDFEKEDYFIEFNVNGLLRGDLASRYNAYAVARQNGWMSANDILRKEGEDLIPAELGGDRYLCNGNMVDIGSAGTNQTK